MSMNKVSLSLVGVKNGVTREEVAPALAKLYSKPESHFEKHCEHLFDLKKPFRMLKRVDPDIAEQHQKHLDGIGIRSMVSEVRESTGLELMPVDNETEERAKQVAKEEAAKKKEKPPEKKPEIKLSDPKPTSVDEGTITKVEVVEKTGNTRTMAVAAVALIAVVGGALTTKAVLKKYNEKDQYQFAEIEEEVVTPEVVPSDVQLAAARTSQQAIAKEKADPLVEIGTFRNWNSQMSRIKKLTHQLHTLNDATGMTSTMDGLVSQQHDPFVRVIADQQLSKIRLQTIANAVSDEANVESEGPNAEASVKYNNLLQNSTAQIEALPSTLEKMYATLHLGAVYEDIGQLESATGAYLLAKEFAIEIKDTQNPVDTVLVEVMAAEHFEARGVSTRSAHHYSEALAASETIDSTASEAPWAMPFIARSQARAGLFADAYETMDAIPNEEIQGLVMSDITRYASDEEMKQFGPDETTMTATEREIADDPALKLLYDNHKIMQENARKGAAIFNTIK